MRIYVGGKLKKKPQPVVVLLEPLIEENFERKINRDKRVMELREIGYKVRKSHATGQLLHPSYVKDGKPGIDNYSLVYYGILYIVEAKLEVKR